MAAALRVPWNEWTEYVDSISPEYLSVLLDTLNYSVGTGKDKRTLLNLLLTRM